MEARRPSDLEWSESVAGRESKIVFTPSRLQAVPLLVGASLWDSFFVMLWMGLSRVHAPQRAFLFPIAHALVGVVVTWMALARTMNVLRITVNATELTITQGPIPRPSVRIPVASLDHFDVQDGRGLFGEVRRVRVVLRDGRATRLDLALDGLDEVAFVAARLNAALAAAREGKT
jgi:hypothetical protein